MNRMRLGLVSIIVAFMYSRARGENAAEQGDQITESAATIPGETNPLTPELPASAPEPSPDTPASQVSGSSSKPGSGQTGTKGQGTLGEEKASELAWDSSVGREDASRIALDVTNGIRIKDIVQPSAEYHFASFGRPDPFLPKIRVNRNDRRTVKEGDPDYEDIQITSVLQKYPLTELQIVGIWNPQNAPRKALVNTPNGEGVVIQMGDSIGIKAGKVIAIAEDFVSVREFEISFDGTRQFQDLKLWITGKKPPEAEFIRLGGLDSKKANGEVQEPQQPATSMSGFQNTQRPSASQGFTNGAMKTGGMPPTYKRQVPGSEPEKPAIKIGDSVPDVWNGSSFMPSSNTSRRDE